jgi:hypothetical protein
MPRRYPRKWKMLRVSEDTHAVLGEMRRPGESFSQAITRMIMFYSDLFYDVKTDTWAPSESDIYPRPVDMSDFGVKE